MIRVLTDIYPPEIKPVREGWYLTWPDSFADEDRLTFARWANGLWEAWHGYRSDYQDRFWRGLTFDPARAEQVVHYDRTDDGTGREGVFIPGAEIDHD